jgi:hypothetical protein
MTNAVTGGQREQQKPGDDLGHEHTVVSQRLKPPVVDDQPVERGDHEQEKENEKDQAKTARNLRPPGRTQGGGGAHAGQRTTGLYIKERQNPNPSRMAA